MGEGGGTACGLATQRNESRSLLTLETADKISPSHASAINFTLQRTNIHGISFLHNQSQGSL